MKWFEQVQKDAFSVSDDREKGLFRIIPFDSLLQMLNEKKNTLVRTSLWEDVYENFMLKEHYRISGVINSVSDLVDCCFGQCWTIKSSSDAMWRIYSPDKKSVRIKTTIGRLWDSVSIDIDREKRFVLGKVMYFSQNQIRDDLLNSSPFRISEIGELVVSSMFAKRSSFSHESEYRLIYKCNKDSDDFGKNIKTMDIDPLSFIINVYFDPRADKAYVDRCSKILCKAFGYPANRIHQSSLYSFKPCIIDVV